MNKVIHILGSISPGGAELALLNIIKNWKDDHFHFSVYYIKGAEILKEEFNKLGVETTFLNWKSERDFNNIPKLIKMFKTDKPDIVHSHLTTGNYWTAIAARLSQVPNYVETTHCILNPTKFGRILHSAFRPLHYRLIDSSIVVSEKVGEHLAEKYYNSKEKILKISCGISNLSDDLSEQVEKIRHEFNILENHKILLTIANLRPEVKGYEIFLESIKKLLDSGVENFHLLIAGAPDIDFPEFAKEIKHRSEALGISNKISFLGFRKDTVALLEIADIFVIPSLSEGQSITLLEALRAGKPIVATDVGAVSEAIINDENGIIVQPGNAELLKDGIIKMLNMEDKWPLISTQNKEIFRKYFTIEQTVDDLTELYNRLIEQ